MKWTNKPPAEIGWYWTKRLNGPDKGEIDVVRVRLFGGELSIHNCSIRARRNFLWAGPIPLPEED